MHHGLVEESVTDVAVDNNEVRNVGTGVELAWWHANKFPMHRFADTFDVVISTAVATVAIGRGTASPALRGGVVA